MRYQPAALEEKHTAIVCERTRNAFQTVQDAAKIARCD